MQKFKSIVIFSFAILLLLLAFIYETIIIFGPRESLTRNLIISREYKFQSSAISKVNKKNDRLFKYILQWTTPIYKPFSDLGEGQEAFISRKCPYTNCIATSNKSLLNDYINFDAIIFDGSAIQDLAYFPKRRSLHQIFVFATMESPSYNPICTQEFNGFYNWTWTFKLDSEVRATYIAVKNNDGIFIGPNKNIRWIKYEDMEPTSDELKKQLKSKTKAAAWFVSNCESKSIRERYYWELQKEMDKYNLEIDIYGSCGTFNCSRDNETICDKLIKDTYYFYLSFENSFDTDYVTEKLLRPLQNDVVPIVVGSGDYKSFMPEGIYLDATSLSIPKLVERMKESITYPEIYANFFKWKKYYSYHMPSESVETDPICLLCSALNNREMVESVTIYKDFLHWWNTPDTECKQSNKKDPDDFMLLND